MTIATSEGSFLNCSHPCVILIYYPIAKATAVGFSRYIRIPSPTGDPSQWGSFVSSPNRQTKEKKKEQKEKGTFCPVCSPPLLLHLRRRLKPHFHLHLVPLLRRRVLRRCVFWGGALALLPRRGGGGDSSHPCGGQKPEHRPGISLIC